jgi:hypothetical protein
MDQQQLLALLLGIGFFFVMPIALFLIGLSNASSDRRLRRYREEYKRKYGFYPPDEY